MDESHPQTRKPSSWVPSLYFAEGIPYVAVMTISVIMYKRFGISNTDIALYTSYLYLPWVIKPLWSPFVDMFRTKRSWVVSMQLLIGLSLTMIALVIHLPGFFVLTLSIFWVMAFSSATHDIAADGYYMLALPEYQQAAYNGVRSTAYRVAMVVGQGVLVVFAGLLEQSQGIATAWSITFFIIAALFLGFFVYHRVILPYPVTDRSSLESGNKKIMEEFLHTFKVFFKRKDIGRILAFLLLFRFAEAQLVKLVIPFLIDVRDKGGLGLSTEQVGVVYGTVGVIALLIGGLLGGYLISRFGLKKMLWIMVISIHLPDVVFIYLSQVQPDNFTMINMALAVEQFGYGFGFAAYMMFMIMVSEGEYKTAHYAICTGIMALGMMLPGMFSGWLEDQIGYQNFFLWVVASTIPGFIVAAMIHISPDYGKKTM